MSEKTATQLAEEYFNERRKSRVDMAIGEFTARFVPEDPSEAAEFHAHFHRIVREIYSEMNEPVRNAMETFARYSIRMPWPVTRE